jgi:type IV pilus assembly protein PilM
MVTWFSARRYGPIGVDLGSRSVKLLQLNGDCTRVVEAARWDLPPANGAQAEGRVAEMVQAIRHAREGRRFRGREAVFALPSGELFVQNFRVAQATGPELDKIVSAEASGRLPFGGQEAEIRYIEAADVRQGDVVRREVIVLACRRAVIETVLAVAEGTGLQPRAIDVPPAALLRCYCRQFRRDEDQQMPMMLVNLGTLNTAVVISRGADAMFVKYVDVGGQQLDQAVARSLKMSLPDAAALRRHNGDRRADQRDPEVTRSIAEAIRPELERLTGEISMCLRYYSVTFRGQPLARVILGGGEAGDGMAEWLGGHLDIPCELGDPLRTYDKPGSTGRSTQWDVAAGLALRELN